MLKGEDKTSPPSFYTKSSFTTLSSNKITYSGGFLLPPSQFSIVLLGILYFSEKACWLNPENERISLMSISFTFLLPALHNIPVIVIGRVLVWVDASQNVKRCSALLVTLCQVLPLFLRFLKGFFFVIKFIGETITVRIIHDYILHCSVS